VFQAEMKRLLLYKTNKLGVEKSEERTKKIRSQ